MVTLFGGILGFLGALVPEFFKLWHEREDRRHELAIMERQLTQQAKGASERLEEIHARSEAIQARALYKTYATGIRWVDALNGTVRPVLAYAFFVIYALVKILQYGILTDHLTTPFEALVLLWGAEDQALFAAIISFYYGQRALQKMRSH